MSTFMKKSFYYNLVPSKAEEEACKANNTPFQVTRVLVEVRDVYTPTVIDHHQISPWHIMKRLTQHEVVRGKIAISYSDACEHVLRYWELSKAKQVVLGHKMPVYVFDVSDENNPNGKRYGGSISEGTLFEMLPNEDYALSCPGLLRERCLGAEDEIALYWEPRAGSFQFRLLRRASI